MVSLPHRDCFFFILHSFLNILSEILEALLTKWWAIVWQYQLGLGCDNTLYTSFRPKLAGFENYHFLFDQAYICLIHFSRMWPPMYLRCHKKMKISDPPSPLPYTHKSYMNEQTKWEKIISYFSPNNWCNGVVDRSQGVWCWLDWPWPD